MVKVALFVRPEAKLGKEKEVENFLLGDLPIVIVKVDVLASKLP